LENCRSSWRESLAKILLSAVGPRKELAPFRGQGCYLPGTPEEHGWRVPALDEVSGRFGLGTANH
jgi:hypothetical protein